MSEFNSEPIDIIIPWVNPNDNSWKKEFEYWKERETGNKDACRYRDWGFIKYVLRSIDQNCKWCRYVFLVLASKTQIPSWLNTECPRLKIVYHKDYIPEEFLPTFNSNVIELCYPNIDELSENFILCNDDTFFMQNKPENFYFISDKPILRPSRQTHFDPIWGKTVKNSLAMSNKILKTNFNFLWSTNHSLVCYNKSLFKFIMFKLNLEFKRIFSHSKFRQPTNFMHYLINDIHCKLNHCIIRNDTFGKFYSIKPGVKYNLNFPVICINEGEQSTTNEINNALKLLERKFPTRSNFENE